MFKLFNQKPVGELITLKISGLHCTSCVFNIDSELEDTKGILSVTTSYAKALSKIVFDSKLISAKKIIEIIKNLGYKAKVI